MKIRLNHVVKLLALAGAMTAASVASAQSAGAWLGTIGINKISPKVESGNISAPALPDTKAAVGDDTKPIFNIAYMFTDHVSTELDLGVPYTSEFIGDGSIKGAGKLGTSDVLPPTLFIQYRFLDAGAKFRPYVGLGATYAYFRKETGSGQLTALINTGGPATSFSLKNKAAVSFQLGASVALNQRWFASVGVIKTYLKTTATYSTGQTQDIKLDPVSMNVGIGYRF